MAWIKKHYDQFALALFAVVLIALSVLLVLRAKSIGDNFADAQATVVPSEKITPMELTNIESARKAVAQPAQWQPVSSGSANLFVSKRYYIANGAPVVSGGGSNKDSLTGKDIPNGWYLDNKLPDPVVSPSIAKEDPDKDGFTNEDEWRGTRDGANKDNWHDSTNPNDPKSHPPYYTKLFLKEWIRTPFRLLFQAYDGDPKKPESMSFQINAIDRGQRTEFLKLGEKVPNSSYLLKSFEAKTVTNPSTGAETDVSELTVLNTETNVPVILIKEKTTDSPESMASFEYEFNGKPITVKKLGKFVLLPESDKFYKLIDIKEGEALIQLPSGEKYVVIPDLRKH